MTWPPEIGVTPYFQDADVVLYHADCRTILPLLAPASVDLVLTDPPYGVGLAYMTYDDNLDAWKANMKYIVAWIRQWATMGILPSCQIREMPFIYTEIPPDWLIAWHKGSPGTAAFVGFMIIYFTKASFSSRLVPSRIGGGTWVRFCQTSQKKLSRGLWWRLGLVSHLRWAAR